MFHGFFLGKTCQTYVLFIEFKGLGRLVLRRSGKNSGTVLGHHYSHAPIHFLKFSVMAEK